MISHAFSARASIWLLAAALAPPGVAQTPALVADIDQRPAQPNPSSDPDGFHGGLFAATEPSVGREVFDGSRVWDIRPGPNNSNPREITKVGGVWVCSAHTASQGRELVVLDPSGTVTVIDVHRGVGSSNPTGLTPYGANVYFAAKNGPSNTELWRTDGTAAGTTRVLDINPGPAGSNPRELTGFGRRLYFTADDGINGEEIWSTNGTAAGTALTIELLPNNASGSPRSLTRVAGGTPITPLETLYFVADTALGTSDLMATDGTQQQLRVISLGPLGSQPRELTPVGDWLFGVGLFVLAHRVQAAGASPNSEQLWHVSSTGATTLVRNFQWQQGELAPAHLVGGVRGPHPAQFWSIDWLFLTAQVPTAGYEVIGFSGVPPFTSRLVDLNSSGSSNPRDLTVLDGELFLAADDGANGEELWRIYESPSARLAWSLIDIQPGPGGSSPAELATMGINTLFLRADDGVHGREPWKATLSSLPPPLYTSVSTALIADIHQATTSSSPRSLTDAHGITYFAADDGLVGRELWKTDGTAAGTSLVRDIRAGSQGSAPSSLTLLGNHLFFVADDGVNGAEPWVLDLVSGAVQMLADVRPGSAGSSPDSLTVVDDGLLFAADDGVVGRELWRSNGTPAGTALVRDIRPGALGSDPHDFASLGRIAVFAADDGSSGEELWRSNGVTGGTSLLRDIHPGGASSKPLGLARVGPTVWFAADDGSVGRELWRTGGTAATTVLAGDLRPGPQGSTPFGFTRAGASSLFFFADNGVHGREPWSLGASGPFMLADVRVGAASSQPGLSYAACGDRFFFMADDGIHGQELWVSDGTTPGTQLTLDIWPGSRPSLPLQLFATGSRVVWFSATEPTGGNELWVSDGTAAGTQLVAELYPGASSSSPGGFALSRGTLLFSATHPQLGRELWRLDPGASVQEVGVGCARSTIAPTLVATDPVLGGTMNVTGVSPAAGYAAGLMLSLPPQAAVPFPIPGGACYLQLHLPTVVTLGPLPVTTSSVWQLSIPIPNVPALEGAALVMQGYWGPTTSPLGFDITNGVVWRLSAN